MAAPTAPPVLERPTAQPAPTITDATRVETRDQWVRRAWNVRGIWLGAVAYLIALTGTLLLTIPEARGGAALLLLLAGVLGVLAWGRQSWAAPFGPQSRSFSLRLFSPRHIMSLVGIIASGLLAWKASALRIEQPSEQFGAAGWLWLSGMVLLVASTALWPRAGVGDRVSGIGSSDTTLHVRRARGPSTGTGEEAWTLWEIAVFAAIVLLALLLRVWDLDRYPLAIHNDELLTASNAVGAYGNINPVSVFSTVWYGIDLPTLWFGAVYASLELGDYTLTALRMPAALFGAATVIPLYGLLRGTWGRTAAITGALVMAVSIANLHFSRITLNNIVTQFFWAACFYFLIKGLQTHRPVYWALAGIMGGLSEHFYYGTRLLFLILIAFGIYLLVVHWRQGWRYLGHMALLALGFLVAFGPLLAYFMRTPNLYFGRGAGVLTWNHIPTGWDDLVLMWNTLWPLIEQNLLSFSAIPGNDQLYFAPLLLAAEAALLVLGVALLVWRWRHPAAFLLLLAGVSVLFVGGTLVPGPGNINHWTPAFPTIYAAIALPVGAWSRRMGNGEWGMRNGDGERRTKIGQNEIRIPHSPFPIPHFAIVAVGLLVIVLLNVDYYFNRYNAFRPEFEVVALQARHQVSLGTDYVVRGVGRTWIPYNGEMNHYLLKGQDGAQLLNPTTELPIPARGGKGLAFYFIPDNEQYLPLVRSLYPGGTDEIIYSSMGMPLVKVYRLTPEQTRHLHGAHLLVTDPTGAQRRWEGWVPRFGYLPDGMEFPLRARWSGGLYMVNPAAYTIRLDSLPDALITAAGQPLSASQPVTLYPGWQRVVAEAQLSMPVMSTLSWAADGGGFTTVPDGYSWPFPPTRGLFALVTSPGQATTLYRIDHAIGFSTSSNAQALGLQTGVPGPVRARWVGELQVPQHGAYTLEVRTDGQTRLSLDGRDVLAVCSNNEAISASVPVSLTAGWHPLTLDYYALPGQNVLEMYWTYPDGSRILIPPNALRYAPEDAYHAPAVPIPIDRETLPVNCAQP